MSYLGNSNPVAVADGAITTIKLADNAVETAKIADSNVTLAKIEDIATAKVLGRTTAGTGVVEQLAITDFVLGTDIGSTVQGYDADTAKLDVDQTWTGAQRGAIGVVTDGTLDLATYNNFNYTPSATDVLEFSNETAGQSGFILTNNPSGYNLTVGAEVYCSSTFETDISAAGTYLLCYFCVDSTHVYVTATSALT
jgi:hypothetical protein